MPWMSAGAVMGGAALLSGALGADASKSASNAQQKSAQAGINEQARQFDITQKNMAPFLQTGTAANRKLSDLLGVSTGAADPNDPRLQALKDQIIANADAAHQSKYGMSVFDARSGLSAPGERAKFDQTVNDQANQQYLQQYGNTAAETPGYGSLLRKFSSDDLNADPVYKSGLQFGLDQGTSALNSRNIANGTGFDSGATLKQLVKYANDYGTTKAGDAYNRFTNDQNNIYSRLSGQSSTGQTATTNLGQLGAQSSGAISDLITGGANAGAAGIVGGANAWGGALGGIGNIANTYQSQQVLKKLIEKQSGSNSGFSYGSIDPSNMDV